DEMRRGHRSRQSAGDFSFAFEINRQQGEDRVRRHEPVALVDDAEAIGVAVRCQSEIELLGADDLSQLAEIFLVALRRKSSEIRVTIIMYDSNFDARFEQEVIEIIARRPVK